MSAPSLPPPITDGSTNDLVLPMNDGPAVTDEKLANSAAGTTPNRPREAWFKSWLLVSISAWLIGIWSLRMLVPAWHVFVTTVQSKEVYPKHYPDFYLHIVGGITALLIGPFQFLIRLRTKGSWHRWLGRVYVISVLYGGVGGFALAFVAYGGWPSTIYFLLASLWWLTTVVLGYHHARNQNYVLHRRWMIRNYAAALSSVTVRLFLVVPITLNAFRSKGREFDPTETQYTICAWLSMVPCVVISELFLYYDGKRKKM